MVKPLGFGIPEKEVTGVNVKTVENLVRPGLELRLPTHCQVLFSL